MTFRLIEDWKREATRLWTMRAAIIWIVIGVVFALLSLVSDWLQKLIGPLAFSAVFVLTGVTFGTARLLKQAGTEE